MIQEKKVRNVKEKPFHDGTMKEIRQHNSRGEKMEMLQINSQNTKKL